MWAAIIKYHKLDDLNNKHLFLKIETDKSKTKVLADLLSDKGLLPDCRTGLILCPYMALPCVCTERARERQRKTLSHHFLKALISS